MSRLTTKINLQSLISRKPELLYSAIDDEIAILCIKNEEYYYLNKVGSTIWNCIEEPANISNLIEALAEKYEVSTEICELETIQYIGELYNLGIIEINNENYK